MTYHASRLLDYDAEYLVYSSLTYKKS